MTTAVTYTLPVIRYTALTIMVMLAKIVAMASTLATGVANVTLLINHATVITPVRTQRVSVECVGLWFILKN